MTFWAYMLHCRGGTYYTGHTDHMERRIAQHQTGAIPGFTADRLPVELVWSEEFGTREEAKEAEHRINGWSRAKKMALIRGDFGEISRLSRNRSQQEPSVLSLSKDRPSLQLSKEQEQPFDKLRADGSGGVLALYPHPSNQKAFVLTAEALRQSEVLHLTYNLSGNLSNIVIPPPAPPIRTDDLWLSTCFELFVKAEGASYREFNFSPSGAWAAYRFDSHRQGMRPAEQHDPVVRWLGNSLEVQLPIKLSGNERIGLSAIIKLNDDSRLFFALAHPPGEPDFHHEACFAATLPPIEQA